MTRYIQVTEAVSKAKALETAERRKKEHIAQSIALLQANQAQRIKNAELLKIKREKEKVTPLINNPDCPDKHLC